MLYVASVDKCNFVILKWIYTFYSDSNWPLTQRVRRSVDRRRVSLGIVVSLVTLKLNKPRLSSLIVSNCVELSQYRQ